MSGHTVLKRISIQSPEGLQSSVDFSRYNEVLLWEHSWTLPPLGLMKDIRVNKNGSFTGVPEFNTTNPMYESCIEAYGAGRLKAYMGGKMDGNTFILYEISLSLK